MAKTSRLPAKQLQLLARLKKVRSLDGFYLVGGSAVGWHFGHRRSADLELFSLGKGAALLPIVVALTAEGARLRTETDVMIGLEAEGIPVDIVQYRTLRCVRHSRAPRASLSQARSTSV